MNKYEQRKICIISTFFLQILFHLILASPVFSQSNSIEEMQEATVRIMAVDASGTAWSGSGTIISPDGLILTNAHVSGTSTVHTAALYSSVDLLQIAQPVVLTIEVLESVDRPPVPAYIAETVATDGMLDLAVLKIVSNTAGEPVKNLRLPYLLLGDSDKLMLGDELRVLGYPGAGGDTITFTRGDVSGFELQQLIGYRSWIKSDATFSPGNSGGLGADSEGHLIGIPSYVMEASGGSINRLRSINLARPLIEAAREGREYRSPYETFGTGSESLSLTAWTDTLDEEGCAVGSIASYPSRTPGIAAVFSHSGLIEGQPLHFVWFYDDEYFVSMITFWNRETSGDCLVVPFHAGGQALPDGRYSLQIFGGPKLETAIAAETVTIGGPALSGGYFVTGSAIDAGSGHAVRGASVFVLLPGTNIRRWVRSPSWEEVYSTTETDIGGFFKLPESLKSKEEYPLIITAEGYRVMTGSLTPDSSWPNPVSLEVKLTR